MTDIETGWITGMFEGEGCIKLPKGQPNAVQLQVTSTDLDILNRFQSIVSCGTVKRLIRSEKYELGRKPVYVWNVNNKSDVTYLLTAMLPLFGERRREKSLVALKRLENNRGKLSPR